MAQRNQADPGGDQSLLNGALVLLVVALAVCLVYGCATSPTLEEAESQYILERSKREMPVYSRLRYIEEEERKRDPCTCQENSGYVLPWDMYYVRCAITMVNSSGPPCYDSSGSLSDALWNCGSYLPARCIDFVSIRLQPGIYFNDFEPLRVNSRFKRLLIAPSRYGYHRYNATAPALVTLRDVTFTAPNGSVGLQLNGLSFESRKFPDRSVIAPTSNFSKLAVVQCKFVGYDKDFAPIQAKGDPNAPNGTLFVFEENACSDKDGADTHPCYSAAGFDKIHRSKRRYSFTHYLNINGYNDDTFDECVPMFLSDTQEVYAKSRADSCQNNAEYDKGETLVTWHKEHKE